MTATRVAFQMEHVYKKFTKGELYASLRDFLPALAGRMLKRAQPGGMKQNEFWAVRDISFQVNRGEAFGIIGHNGAGKSTLLKLLSRVMHPTMGEITVNGTLSALIEVSAGFHPDLTGRENIYLKGTILGMRRSEIKRKFDEIVEFSGMAEFIDTPVKRYSSGMFARLGFAVAAHVEPDILIVDEVLSVGDVLFQKKCLEKMRSIRQLGATVIFVSHNLKAVSELCGRALLLDRGSGIAIGPAADIIKSYLDRALTGQHQNPEGEACISSVLVRGDDGETAHFTSGQKAHIEITGMARQACSDLGIAMEIRDDNYYPIFDTSAYRLGCGTFSLAPGQSFRCTFELDLHLGPGVFHVGVFLHRYDVRRDCDTRLPAATIIMQPDRDIIGPVNLYPRVRTTVGHSALELLSVP